MVKLFCASTLTLVASLMLVTPAANADPAIIITDFACGLLDGDGFGFGTTDTKVVSSQNGKPGNRNINFKCHATGVPNSTGKAVHWNFDNTGFTCGTLFGSTTDWKETVSAGGKAVLTCKIH